MATPRTGRPRGRPKGSKTKVYRPHLEKILAAGPGLLPKDLMLAVMRLHFRARRYDEAVAVAEKVAPFIHPRLTASAVTVRPSIAEQLVAMSDDELRESIKEMERMAGITEEGLAAAKPKGSA